MVELLCLTSRSATLYCRGKNPFYHDHRFMVHVDSRTLEFDQNVFTIRDLEPDTEYRISSEGEELILHTKKESACLHLSAFHPLKDGIHDDTVKLQAAIMCTPDGGTVWIEKGTYLVTSLYLKSNITLYFEEGAKLISATDRNLYPVHPGLEDGINLGVWQGEEVSNFASVINGIGVHDVDIIGGELDSRAGEGDWYQNHREMKTAWRGHGLFLNRSGNIRVTGMQLFNTFSWAVHPYFSENVEFYNISVKNLPSMPTTDGINPDFCKNVTIMGSVFDVGDDCIAIKSGDYAMGKKYDFPCESIKISENRMMSGHGGVVLGSECSGGIRNVSVSRCLFQGTDRGLRIKTRRGRGSVHPIENISFDDIRMENVKTPFTVNMYYNMGAPGGHEEYVSSKEMLPKNELTPVIGKFRFSNMKCEGVSCAAGVFLGLPESPVEGIELENVEFIYAKDAEEGYPVMMEHNIAMKKRGLCILNVNELKLKNVTFKGIEGEEVERMD